MRFATISNGHGPTAVVLRGPEAVPVPVLGEGGGYRDIGELLAAGERGLADARHAAADGVAATGEVTFLRPVLRPHATLCVALNYRSHLRETGRAVPEAPIWFDKVVGSLANPDADVPLPTASVELDYEGELAVVIGRPCRGVDTSGAWDYVAGVTLLNDVSIRDLQRERQQVFLGKNLEHSTAVGPVLVTMDELGPFEELSFELRVNGELRQRGTASDLLFDVPTLIADLAAVMTLQPGDIIATGTPSGIAAGFDPPRWLRDGDVVELEAPRIGILRNRFVSSRVTG